MSNTLSRNVYDALITKWKTKAATDTSATAVDVAQGMHNTLKVIFEDPSYALLTVCIMGASVILEGKEFADQDDAVLRVAVTIKDLLSKVEQPPIH